MHWQSCLRLPVKNHCQPYKIHPLPWASPRRNVRLRLALAQQTQLLPSLAAGVAAAGADRALPEPAATKKHVAVCALLGAFAGSINHTDVEADS